jgi:hypothetical protein
MSDHLCIRGCVNPPRNEGEEPTPRLATSGLLCSADHRRLTRALEIIPDLMANMRAQVSGTAAYRFGDRVQGGGDGSPAPFRVGPLDALDALYARLTTWIEFSADSLGQRPPTLPAWRTAPDSDAQGGPSLTAEGTLVIVTEMTRWLTLRLPAIEELPLVADLHDELCYGLDDQLGIFSLDRLYGVEPVRHRSRVCPGCDHRTVHVAAYADGSLVALCNRVDCSWSQGTHAMPRVSPTQAAAQVGVSKTTILRWMKLDKVTFDRDEAGDAHLDLASVIRHADTVV